MADIDGNAVLITACETGFPEDRDRCDLSFGAAPLGRLQEGLTRVGLRFGYRRGYAVKM